MKNKVSFEDSFPPLLRKEGQGEVEIPRLSTSPSLPLQRGGILSFFPLLCVVTLAASVALAVLATDAFSLAPQSSTGQDGFSADYVLRSIAQSVDDKTSSPRELAQLLVKQGIPPGIRILSDFEHDEIVIADVRGNWALYFSDRPKPSPKAQGILLGLNLAQSENFRPLARAPKIFVSQYVRAALHAAQTLDGSRMPGWTLSFGLETRFLLRAIPWSDYPLEQSAKERFAALLDEVELECFPVKIVQGEGTTFAERTNQGNILESFTHYQRDARGRPIALLLPEGALRNARDWPALAAALQHEIDKQKIYATLRIRLKRQFNFDADPAKEAQLRHAAENLATLAEKSTGGISKRIRRLISRGRQPFVKSLAAQMPGFKEWIGKNEILAALSRADVRALGLFGQNKDGRNLMDNLQAQADKIAEFSSHFIPAGTVSGPIAATSGPPSLWDGAIQNLLAEERALVYGDEEAVDADLSEYAKRRDIPYLRVSPRDLRQWRRLLIQPRLVGGEFFALPGPLIRIIEDGGILLLDYNGSDPALVAGLNCLFDRLQRFENHKVSDQLQVVGVLRPERLHEFSCDFFSRSAVVTWDSKAEDPLKNITQVKEAVGEDVDLMGTPNFYEELIGRFILDGKGQPHKQAGKLLEALEGGHPITIRGADWDDPGFVNLIRQIYRQGGVSFDGTFYPMNKGFSLYRGEEPDRGKGVEQKSIASPTQQPGALWLINSQTQDILFTKNEVVDGRQTQRPGLLRDPGETPLRLRLQGKIGDWVWHRIMHAPGVDVEIEVGHDTEIPQVYQPFVKQAVPGLEAPLARPKQTLQQVKDDPVVVLYGDDSGYAQARLAEALVDRETVTFPINPYTSWNDISGTIDIAASPEGLQFSWNTTALIEMLQAGKTVVLTHLESNPDLAQRLETALTEQPYLLVNGRRVNLPTERGGRLVLVAARDIFPNAQKKVSVEVSASKDAAKDSLYPVLAKEFPALTSGAWLKLRRLEKACQTIPAPKIPRQYPQDPLLTLPRLRRILSYADWAQGIREVIIEEYRHVPEIAAFMNVATRLLLGGEEAAGRIDGKKLRLVDNQIVEPIRRSGRLWQCADCLSLDLLRKSGLALNFSAPGANTVLQTIMAAKIVNSRPERRAFAQAMYRAEMGQDAPAQLEPIAIDQEGPAPEESPDARYRRALAAVGKFRVARFTGPPGVGKSYYAKKIAEDPHLGYAHDQIYGPITTGPAVRPSEIMQEKIYDEDAGLLPQDKVIARWAKDKRGGILLVDEFNLPTGAFWNLLSGFFAPAPSVWVAGQRIPLGPNHRIIFTGNQEFVTGRNESALVREHFPTIYFPPLPAPYLTEEVAKGHFAEGIEGKKELAEFLVGLHGIFEKMSEDQNFSLRQLQEVADRINREIRGPWDRQAVALIAWRVYEGNFSPEQRVALRNCIANIYQIDIFEVRRRAIGETSYPAGFPKNIVKVPSVKQLMWDVQTFITLRQAREDRPAGQPDLQGQRAMLIEAPPARGKDIVAGATLEAMGYKDAAEYPDAVRKYYHLNASRDYDKVLSTIQKARGEGAIVVVSELNALPSALVEGSLNDALTGSARPGFAFIATVNSAEFSGREHFSSALQDRLWVRHYEDYGRTELYRLAMYKNRALPRAKVKALVNAHCWIRSQIKEPRYRPTLRELERALGEMTHGASVSKAVQEVYGPTYLKHFLIGREVPDNFPDPSSLDRKIDNAEVLRLVGVSMLPDRGVPLTICQDARTKTAGYRRSTSDAQIIAFKAATDRDEIVPTAYHEFGHGLFTRHFEGLTPHADDPYYKLTMGLEDMRQVRALEKYFPGIPVQEDLDDQFVLSVRTALQSEQWRDFCIQMDCRAAFVRVLCSFAKGLLKKEDVEMLTVLTQKEDLPNPFDVAHKHLEAASEIYACIPETLGEEEILYQQHRALLLMQQLKDAFLSLPAKAEEEIPEKTPVQEQNEIEAGRKNLERLDLGRTPIQPPLPVKTEILAISLPKPPAESWWRRLYHGARSWIRHAAPQAPITLPHAHPLKDKKNPVPIVPPEVEFVPMGLEVSLSERHVRNAEMRRATQRMGNDFHRKLAPYIMTKLLIGRDYGTDGPFDADQYLVDPSRPCLSTAPVTQEMPKEIVLLGGHPEIWNVSPILDEIFLALFQEGLTVTVYAGNTLIQEGIRTLFDLKIAVATPTAMDLSAVEKDIARRKRAGSYVFTTLSDLQKAIEAEYVYQLIDHPAPEAITPEISPPAVPVTPPEEIARVEQMSVEEQCEHIKKGLAAQIGTVADDMVRITGERSIQIQLSSQLADLRRLTNLDFLRGATHVRSVTLEGIGVEDFSPLASLKNMLWLVINDMPHFQDEHLAQITKGSIAPVEDVNVPRTSVGNLSLLRPWKNSIKEINAKGTLVEDGSVLDEFEHLELVHLTNTPLKSLWKCRSQTFKFLAIENTDLLPVQIAQFKKDHPNVEVAQREEGIVDWLLENKGKRFRAVTEGHAGLAVHLGEYLKTQHGIPAENFFLEPDGFGGLTLTLENWSGLLDLTGTQLPWLIRTIKVSGMPLPHFAEEKHVRRLVLENVSLATVGALKDRFPMLCALEIAGTTTLSGDMADRNYWREEMPLREWTWRPEMGLARDPRQRESQRNSLGEAMIPKHAWRINFIGYNPETDMAGNLRKVAVVIDTRNVPLEYGRMEEGSLALPPKAKPPAPKTIFEEIAHIKEALKAQGVEDTKFLVVPWEPRLGESRLHVEIKSKNLKSIEFLRGVQFLGLLVIHVKHPLDFSPLYGISTLQRLGICSPFFRDQEFREIASAGLPLRELDISDTSVSDLGPVPRWKDTLAYISFRNTPVQDASPLGECQKLQSIDGSGSRIASLPFEKNTNLEKLAIEDTNVSVLRALAFVRDSKSRGVKVWFGKAEEYITKSSLQEPLILALRDEKRLLENLPQGLLFNPDEAEIIITPNAGDVFPSDFILKVAANVSQITVRDRAMPQSDPRAVFDFIHSLVLENVRGGRWWPDLIQSAMPNLKRIHCKGALPDGFQVGAIGSCKELILEGIPFSKIDEGVIKLVPSSLNVLEIKGSGADLHWVDEFLIKKCGLHDGVVVRLDKEVILVSRRAGVMRVAKPERLLGQIVTTLVNPETTMGEIYRRFDQKNQAEKFFAILKGLVTFGIIPADQWRQYDQKLRQTQTTDGAL